MTSELYKMKFDRFIPW